jgi:hypothetical protein
MVPGEHKAGVDDRERGDDQHAEPYEDRRASRDRGFPAAP